MAEIEPRIGAKLNGWGPWERVKTGLRLFEAVGIKGAIRKILPCKNRKVLSDNVPEVGAEHADVETPSVTQANHGLGIKRVGKTKAWRERFVGIVDVAIRADPAVAGDSDRTVI